VGILPGDDEKSLYSENASRTIEKAATAVDALFLFDNGAWTTRGKRHTPDYDALNEALVRRLGAAFAADFDGNNPHLLPASLCTTDIATTLAAGGVTTIGYASRNIAELQTGLFERLAGHRTPPLDVRETTVNTVKKALHGRFTVPCDPTAAETALLSLLFTLASGRPNYHQHRRHRSGYLLQHLHRGSIRYYSRTDSWDTCYYKEHHVCF